MGDNAFHVRRRLSAREAPAVGDVLDIRGTEEAWRRAAMLGARLRLAPPEVLAEELALRPAPVADGGDEQGPGGEGNKDTQQHGSTPGKAADCRILQA